ncbi:MAG: hypothetical protein II462_04735, partial [Muribaculaceae bacterium]|nr:hypothetical protein [Muribaculaceae bacterium]
FQESAEWRVQSGEYRVESTEWRGGEYRGEREEVRWFSLIIASFGLIYSFLFKKGVSLWLLLEKNKKTCP